MLYTFKSKASGDVVMLGEVGDQMLRLLGEATTDQGILPAADLPGAIAALQAAITRAESRSASDAIDSDEPAPDAVSLRQRAWPLLALMKAAQAADAAVTWGV